MEHPRPNVAQSIVFLPTPDLAATAEFYEAILGLELALDQGSCRIYRVAGAGYWGFCAAAEPPAEPARTILTLVAEDVEGWYRLLVDEGVAVDGPPRVNEVYRIFHFFAADPNGYRIEVQRFLDPKWDPGS
ncbi:MAG: VOC family protein [Fimbriimonadaceae bacterium]